MILYGILNIAAKDHHKISYTNILAVYEFPHSKICNIWLQKTPILGNFRETLYKIPTSKESFQTRMANHKFI